MRKRFTLSVAPKARSRRAVAFLLCVGFLAASRASAQDASSPYRLYANPSFYAGSARAMSLGGAYLPIAEGASYTSNLASFAQPSPYKGEWWDFDLTLQVVATPGAQDLDNDGVVDGVDSEQRLGGLALRLGKFGIGAYGRVAKVCLTSCGAKDAITFTHSGLAMAYAFFDGQLVGSIGVEALTVRMGESATPRDYKGNGLTVDMLFRPAGKPFRLAAALRPNIVAGPDPALPGAPTSVFYRPAPSAAVAPQVLSLGIMAKLDKGGEQLNDERERSDNPSAALDATALIRDIFRTRYEKPPGKWMVTAQLDLTFPEPEAVQLDTFVHDVPPAQLGTRLLFTPRLGFEHVTAPGRLRLRAGTWLEPSPWIGRDARLHATAGFDLFLFHVLLDWGITGAADYARGVSQGGISFGVWH